MTSGVFYNYAYTPANVVFTHNDNFTSHFWTKSEHDDVNDAD